MWNLSIAWIVLNLLGYLLEKCMCLAAEVLVNYATRICSTCWLPGLLIIHDVSRITCAHQCVLAPSCSYFSYDNWNQTCGLSKEKVNLTCMSESSGWSLYHIGGDCGDGWQSYNGSCYMFSQQKLGFIEAQNLCEQHGANMVHVDDFSENEFIKRMISTSAVSFWLGLTDEAIEGEWRWLDNDDLLTFSDWTGSGPNNGERRGNENCAVFSRYYDFEWNDLPCNETKHVICEKRSLNAEIC